MPGKTPERLTYSIACACGARQRLDARDFGRLRLCKSCGASFTVAWGRDKTTRKPVPVAVAQARMRAGVRSDRTPFVAACRCGYRRPVSQAEAATTPKCPGCGKTMTVERVAGAPSPETKTGRKKADPNAPPLPLHLRPPQKILVQAGTRVMNCPCGERLLIRPTSLGKPTQCPNCDRWLLIEEQTAPPPGPPRPSARSTRPGPSLVKTAGRSRQPGAGECVCPCGAIIPPRTSRTGREFTCAACGRKGRVEEVSGAKAGEPAMRAVITEEPKPGPAPKPAPVPEAPAPAPTEAFEAAPEESPFAPSEAAAQAAICACGAELMVSPEDVGAHLQCPGCGEVMTVDHAIDPLGGPPGLKLRTLGRMDEDTWKLEDFK